MKSIIEKQGFDLAGVRVVPTDINVLGQLSKEFVPKIKQLILKSKPDFVNDSEKDFEERLYNLRREIQGNFRKQNSGESYISSLSSKTIVYKGMLRSVDLGRFYLDLTNPKYESAFSIYHRRFSTNTVPKWYLAQPMRLLAHNGEINTLLGNINWVKSRQYSSQAIEAANKDIVLGPLVDVGRSDSANLDSIFENFVRSGRSPQEALMILVPEAYANKPSMKFQPDLKAFYEYYESVQEAWDGPALLVFSDGNNVGAALDRNGLRPARYMVTASENGEKTVHVMSEVGVTKSLSQFAEAGQVGSRGEGFF
jgi:glutamate synthase (ferredoxin)